MADLAAYECLRLMTAAEMKARLENGESALELSIEKWNMIVRVFEEEPNRWLPVEHHGDTCALCEETDMKSDLFYDGCRECPYYLHYGHQCDATEGHWRKFDDWQSVENAIAMRDALIALREDSNFNLDDLIAAIFERAKLDLNRNDWLRDDAKKFLAPSGWARFLLESMGVDPGIVDRMGVHVNG